jgi:hypothetical protein
VVLILIMLPVTDAPKHVLTAEMGNEKAITLTRNYLLLLSVSVNRFTRLSVCL